MSVFVFLSHLGTRQRTHWVQSPRFGPTAKQSGQIFLDDFFLIARSTQPFNCGWATDTKSIRMPCVTQKRASAPLAKFVLLSVMMLCGICNAPRPTIQKTSIFRDRCVFHLCLLFYFCIASCHHAIMSLIFKKTQPSKIAWIFDPFKSREMHMVISLYNIYPPNIIRELY